MNRKLHLILGIFAVWCVISALSPAAGFAILAVQTVVTGTRATAGTQGVLSNTRVIDMSDKIHLLDPNMAPLTAIAMKINKAKAISPKVEWLLDDYLPVTSLSTSTRTADELTLDVTTGTGVYFRAGDVLKILDTGENVMVSAISTDALTVVRATGSTSAAQWVPGATVLIIGNANNEGATSRVVKTTQKTADYNYTQIWRWPFASTGTTQASELYGGPDLNYQSKKAGMEHRINMERSLLFGERKETTGTTPIRYAGGLFEKITTNVTAIQTYSMETLEYFLRDLFRYGPHKKMLAASRNIVSWINLVADTKLQTRVSDTKFPMDITEYRSPHGLVYIVPHHLLTQDVTATHKYQGYALGLDLDCIFYRYLQGRDTRLKTNIQAPDADERKDEFITEGTWQIIQEQNHAVATTGAGYA